VVNLTNMDGLRPLGERIVLRPDKPPSQEGLIIIPNQAQKPAGRGTVVKMGPGMLTKSGGRWPMPDIAVGDVVYYDARVHDYCEKFKIDGVEHIIVFPERVLAVEEADAAAAQ
jgi:co-chaperonin GroES (HSP10)